MIQLYGFLEVNGRLCTSSSLIVRLILVLAGSTTGAPPLTSIEVLTAPNLSAPSTTASRPAWRTISVNLSVVKPSFVTVSVYVPSGRGTIKYQPSSPESTLREYP